jgi:hypothetical protein
VRIGQVPARRRFLHPQIMPDLSSPQTCIKSYENRPRRLIKTPFLPTLKPEEPSKLMFAPVKIYFQPFFHVEFSSPDKRRTFPAVSS